MTLGRSVNGLHVLDRPSRATKSGEPGTTTVVYIHGAMDRSGGFLRVMRRLRDIDQMAFDRRGYGRSSSLSVASGFDQHVEDLLRVLAGTPAVLVGHSAGGAVALAAARTHPELVRSVLVYETPRAWLPWWPRSKPPIQELTDDEAVHRFMRDVVGAEVWAGLPSSTRDARLREGASLRADVLQLEGGEIYDASQVTVPVVAAYGTRSGAHHQRGMEELVAELPDGHLHVVGEADHVAHMTHPTEFADLVLVAMKLGAA